MVLFDHLLCNFGFWPAHFAISEMLRKNSHKGFYVHELWHIFNTKVPLEVDEQHEGSEVVGGGVIKIATAQVLDYLGNRIFLHF